MAFTLNLTARDLALTPTNPTTRARRIQRAKLRDSGKSQTDWVADYRAGTLPVPTTHLPAELASAHAPASDVLKWIDVNLDRSEAVPLGQRRVDHPIAHGRPRDVLAFIDTVIDRPVIVGGGNGSAVAPARTRALTDAELYDELRVQVRGHARAIQCHPRDLDGVARAHMRRALSLGEQLVVRGYTRSAIEHAVNHNQRSIERS